MKVLTIFGTRPEAIKLAPVIRQLESDPQFESQVCVSGQHREMLDPFLELFGITPRWDLNIMRPEQSLFDVTIEVLGGMERVLQESAPDVVLVQGDTTTAFVGALAAFYEKVPVGHVEAGLRSGNRHDPFPEDMNRRLVDRLSDLYFAPTKTARRCLLQEGIADEQITVTGNTVIDALFLTLEKTSVSMHDKGDVLSEIPADRRVILVTSHRRESFGKGLENICLALREIAKRHDVELVFPVHLNPSVRRTATQELNGVGRIHLLEPLDYVVFVRLLNRAYLVLTDSGGIQEEAPALNKPVLVMRNATERPELIEVGAGKLVGTDCRTICEETLQLLDDPEEYDRMASAPNPFGDGHAAERIVSSLLKL